MTTPVHSLDRYSSPAQVRAAAMRPQIVGETLQAIAQDPEVSTALFEILETQKILESRGEILMLPADTRGDLLTQLAATAPVVDRSHGL